MNRVDRIIESLRELSEDYKAAIEGLREAQRKQVDFDRGVGLKGEIYQYGKSLIVKDCLMKGKIKDGQSFKEFVGEMLVKIPSFISWDDFIKEFEPELYVEYMMRGGNDESCGEGR